MCEFIIYASVLWGQAKRFGTTQFNFEENHLGQMAILINTFFRILVKTSKVFVRTVV